MKSFEVNGISYRSISEFCKKNGISYSKMRRLCRHYVRAKKNPSIAARWILGCEVFNISTEPKTHEYFKDNELSRLRQIDFQSKAKLKSRKHLLKLINSTN